MEVQQSDTPEFGGRQNSLVGSPARAAKVNSSLTKRDGSVVKSILKLRKSQSLKKVSFGHDEIIYQYGETIEVQEERLVRASTLPELGGWAGNDENVDRNWEFVPYQPPKPQHYQPIQAEKPAKAEQVPQQPRIEEPVEQRESANILDSHVPILQLEEAAIAGTEGSGHREIATDCNNVVVESIAICEIQELTLFALPKTAEDTQIQNQEVPEASEPQPMKAVTLITKVEATSKHSISTRPPKRYIGRRVRESMYPITDLPPRKSRKTDCAPSPMMMRTGRPKHSCGVCGTPGTDLRLACAHVFHSQCYDPRRNHSRCKLCESKNY